MISICIKNNNSKFLNYLINKIKKSDISDIDYSKRTFKIYDNIIIHYKGTDKDKFIDFLANILAKSIIIFYEPTIVKKLINHEYFYFDSHEKNVIFDEYKILIKKMSKDENADKLDTVSSSLKDYFQDNKSIIVDGFINFRLPYYIKYLKFFTNEAVNQFLLDKEYLEFVDLLKSYVDSKIPNDKVVNLIYVNSEAILLSNDGNVLKLDSFDSIYLSDITFSNNDYVLNTLVGLLPSKIILHLITPKDNFINTIELIFGEKVGLCDGCELCHAYNILNLN